MASTSQGWAGRISTILRRGKLDDGLWEDLEEALISADVGVATTFTLLDRVRDRVQVEHSVDVDRTISILQSEISTMLQSYGEDEDPWLKLDPKETGQPLTLLIVGVNGVGKTTAIAKMAHLYLSDGMTVILGAADTFRAAAIEQLQLWGERLDLRVISHRAGADPGAVAFDTVEAAKASGTDVVIIDTAGRLHTNANLMEEIKKIRRAVERAESGAVRVILVLDATTGQNGLQQARCFANTVDCDGIILSKLDGTAKGGIVLAIVSELQLPILFFGTGERSEDFAPFDPAAFTTSLFSAWNR